MVNINNFNPHKYLLVSSVVFQNIGIQKLKLEDCCFSDVENKL